MASRWAFNQVCLIDSQKSPILYIIVIDFVPPIEWWWRWRYCCRCNHCTWRVLGSLVNWLDYRCGVHHIPQEKTERYDKSFTVHVEILCVLLQHTFCLCEMLLFLYVTEQMSSAVESESYFGRTQVHL